MASKRHIGLIGCGEASLGHREFGVIPEAAKRLSGSHTAAPMDPGASLRSGRDDRAAERKRSMPLVPAASETGDPLLLTPGPLTTSRSRQGGDGARLGLARRRASCASTRRCSMACREIIHGEDAFVTVPMQGSGTFAVEAMLTTFVPQERQGAGARQRRLWPARQAHPRDRRAQDRGARDPGGHAARSRGRRAHPQAPDEHHATSSPSIARRRAASSTRSRRSPRSPPGTASASWSTR